MNNLFLYLLCKSIVVLPCALGHTLNGMEVQGTALATISQQTPEVNVSIEEGKASTALSVELKKHIGDGNILELSQLFKQDANEINQTDTAQCTHQLLHALNYTHEQVNLQQDRIATKKCARCCPRYRTVVFPAAVTAFSVVNLTLSILSYCQLQQTPTSIDAASLSINVIGSVIPGIIFGGYETIKYLQNAWHDADQKEKVRRLKTSQLFLEMRHKAALKNNSCTADSHN
ncbi:MAG: hypothetical protein AB7F19_06375 [Candidatus Babeliales bacterium]